MRSPQVYERRLARALEGADIPRHVGVIMDGNRRWARAIGLEDVAHGHRRGADKIVDLLGWCDDAGVAVVTLFMLSTDNLRRPEPELSALLQIIEDVAVDLSAPGPPLAGARDGRAGGAPAGDRRRPQAGRGGHPRPAGRDGQPRRRLRRAAGDRRRRPLAAGRARRARDVAGGPGRGARGRAHRRAPLHARASPTPTWSSAPAASSACRASCSGRRRTPSSTSPTSTGPTSAGSTSCARCATTPRGTAASAS